MTQFDRANFVLVFFGPILGPYQLLLEELFDLEKVAHFVTKQNGPTDPTGTFKGFFLGGGAHSFFFSMQNTSCSRKALGHLRVGEGVGCTTCIFPLDPPLPHLLELSWLLFLELFPLS